jgi:Flp pilus assembly protein TadD
LAAEALRAAERAASLDPQNWFARFCQAFALLLCGDVDSALISMRSALELSGESPVARMHLAIISAYSGREEEALAGFRQVAATGDPAIAAVGMLFEAALSGHQTALARVLSESPLEHLSGSDKEFCWWMADCLCRVGDFDGACRRLERAIALGFVNHRFWSEFDPFLAPLRNHMQFQSLMETARARQAALGLS